MGLKAFLERSLKPKTADSQMPRAAPCEELGGGQTTDGMTICNVGSARPGTKDVEDQSKRQILRKKRSFFGRRPDPRPPAEVPVVPVLKQTKSEYLARPEPEAGWARAETGNSLDLDSRPETTPDAHQDPDRYKTGRPSLSKRLSRTFSKTSLRQLARGDENDELTTLPPLPPMPLLAGSLVRPTSAASPKMERRDSSNILTDEGIRRKRSQPQLKKMRSYIWASSNPDDGECDVPPIPTSRRDTTAVTPEYSWSTDSLRRLEEGARDGRPKTSSRGATQEPGADDHEPLPARSNSSYVPRSAAQGFLSSTNEVSEQTRRNWRKRGMVGAGYPMVCWTDEHQQEWEKLKKLMDAPEFAPSPPEAASDHSRNNSDSEVDQSFAEKHGLASVDSETV